jgi:Ca-activated chloride channel homolog
MDIPKRPRRRRAAWPFFFFAAALIFVHLAAPTRLCAQEPAREAPQPIQSSSDLTVIDVSVLDRNGNFVGGLAQQDFRVLDDGAEKPVQFFVPVDAAAHLVILMETGPAVFLIHDEHMQALSSLLDGLAPDDQAALFAYEDLARQILPFTADKTALRGAVNESQYVVGMDRLNFYDSLAAVLDWLPAGPEKKAIVVLSTGLDDSPDGHWDLLEKKLRANNVVIFSVGLGGPLRGDAPSKPAKKPKKKSGPAPADSGQTPAFAHADEVLRSLAQITGGRAYFPQTADDYAPAYREIAAAVRHQYVLGIAPEHDGEFHKLSIEVLNAADAKGKPGGKTPQYRAFYREGYVAPGP